MIIIFGPVCTDQLYRCGKSKSDHRKTV